MSDIRSDPLPPYPFKMIAPAGYSGDAEVTVYNSDGYNNYSTQGYTVDQTGGSRHRRYRRRRRPSRKYKKSAKRVFRKKSRSTRRR